MPRVTITVPEKNAQPYRFQVDRQVVTLGRGNENDIAIDCGSVSVNHAEMHRIEGGYELRDVGSTNGIKLDGFRQDTIQLTNGASVKLGDVAFDFLLTDEELEILSRENPKASPVIPEPEAAPKKNAAEKIAEQRAALATTSSGGVGFGSIIVFLILAAAAFFAGLAIRHQKETGRSLISDLQNKYAIRKTIEAPAPAGTSAPATEAPAAPAK